MTLQQAKTATLGMMKKAVPMFLGMDMAAGPDTQVGYVYAPYIPFLTAENTAEAESRLAESRRRLHEFLESVYEFERRSAEVNLVVR